MWNREMKKKRRGQRKKRRNEEGKRGRREERRRTHLFFSFLHHVQVWKWSRTPWTAVRFGKYFHLFCNSTFFVGMALVNLPTTIVPQRLYSQPHCVVACVNPLSHLGVIPVCVCTCVCVCVCLCHCVQGISKHKLLKEFLPIIGKPPPPPPRTHAHSTKKCHLSILFLYDPFFRDWYLSCGYGTQCRDRQWLVNWRQNFSLSPFNAATQVERYASYHQQF